MDFSICDNMVGFPKYSHILSDTSWCTTGCTVWFQMLFNLYVQQLPLQVHHCYLVSYANDLTLLEVVASKETCDWLQILTWMLLFVQVGSGILIYCHAAAVRLLLKLLDFHCRNYRLFILIFPRQSFLGFIPGIWRNEISICLGQDGCYFI